MEIIIGKFPLVSVGCWKGTVLSVGCCKGTVRWRARRGTALLLTRPPARDGLGRPQREGGGEGGPA